MHQINLLLNTIKSPVSAFPRGKFEVRKNTGTAEWVMKNYYRGIHNDKQHTGMTGKIILERQADILKLNTRAPGRRCLPVQR